MSGEGKLYIGIENADIDTIFAQASSFGPFGITLRPATFEEVYDILMLANVQLQLLARVGVPGRLVASLNGKIYQQVQGSRWFDHVYTNNDSLIRFTRLLIQAVATVTTPDPSSEYLWRGWLTWSDMSSDG